MESGTVLILVVLVALPIAAVAFMGAGKLLAQIGKGPLAIEEEPLARPGRPISPTPPAVREEEIRQMLQARSDRHVARGEPPTDVEAELRKLLQPTVTAAGYDPGLRDEVRQLVEASNARREARGEEALDVESEIERRLAELGGS